MIPLTIKPPKSSTKENLFWPSMGVHTHQDLAICLAMWPQVHFKRNSWSLFLRDLWKVKMAKWKLEIARVGKSQITFWTKSLQVQKKDFVSRLSNTQTSPFHFIYGKCSRSKSFIPLRSSSKRETDKNRSYFRGALYITNPNNALFWKDISQNCYHAPLPCLILPPKMSPI